MSQHRATLFGLLAILLWSTNSAATIGLVQRLGPFTALALVCGGAGLVLALFEGLRRRQPDACFRIGWRFALVGGVCFLLNQGLFFLAFSLADPALAMPLNLVNYLWPNLTVLLSLAVHRASFRLRPGLLLTGLLAAFAGITVAISPDPSPLALALAVGRCPLAFLAMAGAAAAWAVFSVLAVPLHRPGAASGTPVFFLLVAVVAGGARYAGGEVSAISPGDLPLLAYTALAPAAGGYLLWELAMRAGDVPLLGALSNALPLLSTLVLWLALDIPNQGNLALGALLVSLGAFLVHYGAQTMIPSPAETTP